MPGLAECDSPWSGRGVVRHQTAIGLYVAGLWRCPAKTLAGKPSFDGGGWPHRHFRRPGDLGRRPRRGPDVTAALSLAGLAWHVERLRTRVHQRLSVEESRSARTRRPRRSRSCSSLVKKAIEVLHRPSHGLLDGSFDKRPIKQTRNTRSRLVFDDEPVYAAIARGFKVAFMANIL